MGCIAAGRSRVLQSIDGTCGDRGGIEHARVLRLLRRCHDCGDQVEGSRRQLLRIPAALFRVARTAIGQKKGPTPALHEQRVCTEVDSIMSSSSFAFEMAAVCGALVLAGCGDALVLAEQREAGSNAIAPAPDGALLPDGALQPDGPVEPPCDGVAPVSPWFSTRPTWARPFLISNCH